MQDSKKGITPFRNGMNLSKDQCPKTPMEKVQMRVVLYASAVDSLMNAMLCTRSDICYVMSLVSIYQSNPDPKPLYCCKMCSRVLEND